MNLKFLQNDQIKVVYTREIACSSLMTDDVHVWKAVNLLKRASLCCHCMSECIMHRAHLPLHFMNQISADKWQNCTCIWKMQSEQDVSPEFHLSQCQQDERCNLPRFSSTRRGSQTVQLVFQLHFTAQSFSQLTEGDTKCSREGACPQERKSQI